MYVDEPPKDGNIPDFNISKIDICPFRAHQRSFRLFQSDFSKDIHQRSRLLCFTQNDHTGQTGFKICPFLKWNQLYIKGLYFILLVPRIILFYRFPITSVKIRRLFLSAKYLNLPCMKCHSVCTKWQRGCAISLDNSWCITVGHRMHITCCASAYQLIC